MLRVSRLELPRDEDGAWFIKYTCGGQENVGIPCACFFWIVQNASVPKDHIVHLCMISPKHLRCWQTDYGTQSKTGELLCQAQAQCFIDKKKGIRLSKVVADHLRQAKTQHGEFPRLGPNTLSSHYKEALFMMDWSTCTMSDIVGFCNTSVVLTKHGL